MNESLALKSGDTQKNLHSKFEIEKISKEICTYIDIKFKEQEYIIKKMIDTEGINFNTTETSIQDQQNQTFFENKIILTIKAVAFFILYFLIVLLITTWTLSYLQSFDCNFEIINREAVGDPYASNVGEEITNWILKRVLKFLLPLVIQFISTYFLFKNSYFPPSSPPENDDFDIDTDYDEIFSIFNEVSENQTVIQEILDNIENFDSDKAYNLLDQLSSEYNKREEMLSKIESETEKILIELESDNVSSYHPSGGVESTNNVPDLNYKENPKIYDLGQSLIVSASILGSSMVISSIAPTLLELIIKSVN